MLVNDHNQVFVARRLDSERDAWQMPQGGIDPHEDPRTAALRELREETGTDQVEILAEMEEWIATIFLKISSARCGRDVTGAKSKNGF